MSYQVDFTNVSTIGLESSPVAAALAGSRANEARYFKNKYDFVVEPADAAQNTIEWVHRILKQERDLVIQSRPLQAAAFEVQLAPRYKFARQKSKLAEGSRHPSTALINPDSS